MAQKRLVPFISDEKLIKAVRNVVLKTQASLIKHEKKIDDNILDAFSATYESIIGGIPYTKWLGLEMTRKVQKTMQNAIGDFHQEVIGGIDGWENLGKGRLVDVRNKEKKIIAEIKNKYNTVTGTHIIKIYDELEDALASPEHKGYMAYHVMMITKNRDHLKPFTPSDRTTHSRRSENPKIKEVGGFRFYKMITGQDDALFQLYKVIPQILKNEFKYKIDDFDDENDLRVIFSRTYK